MNDIANQQRDTLPEQHQRLAQLLREALELVPHMSDDDPIAPALADWCHEARMYMHRQEIQ